MFETKEDTQGPKHPQEDGPITARTPWQAPQDQLSRTLIHGALRYP